MKGREERKKKMKGDKKGESDGVTKKKGGNN